MFKVSGNAYVLIGGISDDTTHGYATAGSGNWYQQWTSINTFGSYDTANQSGGYKSRLYDNYNYDDILVMQGFTNTSISSDYYANSTEVARTTNSFLTTRGRNLRSFLSGTNGPNIATSGSTGRVSISVSFLKGTSAASRARYKSNAASELTAGDVIDFGLANNEGYRMAMVNALGCSGSINSEHYSWVADIGNNYSNKNFPEPNYDGTWGISTVTWMYWLFWARS